MNKTELIAAIAERTGLSKQDSIKAVNAFTEIVSEQMYKQEKVSMVGFGTFEVTTRAAREGINPATKEKIKIRESLAPKFKFSSAVRAKVNEDR